MADSKITGLTADTTPTSDDLVVTVNDPGGTPANRKVTLANLALGVGAAWAAYTPTWTGGSPVVNNGTLTGAYAQIGKIVTFRIDLVGGSTTTWGSGTYSFTLPVTAKATATIIDGAAYADQAGTATYAGVLQIATTTTLNAQFPNGTGDTRLAILTAAKPITPTTGSSYRFAGVYEAS